MLIFVLCGCLAAISAQEVEEEVTTPVIDQASVDQLKREASAQCSYRHSTNIVSYRQSSFGKTDLEPQMKSRRSVGSH